MRPNKLGQVVSIHTPLPAENPNQLYVVLETIAVDERPIAYIQALNTGLSFPPMHTVSFNDLGVQKVTNKKASYLQLTGKDEKMNEQKIVLDLKKGVKGVESNACLTIEDSNRTALIGTLFVNLRTIS